MSAAELESAMDIAAETADDMEIELGESWGDVQKAAGAMERIDELMRAAPAIAPPAHREEGQRVVVGAESSFLPRRCVAIQPLERAQIAGGETRIAFEQRVAEADDHL